MSLQVADSVEKVLAAVGTKFLRAADAFNAVRHGGPSRLEQILSATFFFAWRTHPQKKSATDKLLREFCQQNRPLATKTSVRLHFGCRGQTGLS
jgi:hypothetical protein